MAKEKGSAQDGLAADVLDLHCDLHHHRLRCGLDLPGQAYVLEIGQGGEDEKNSAMDSNDVPDSLSFGLRAENNRKHTATESCTHQHQSFNIPNNESHPGRHCQLDPVP